METVKIKFPDSVKMKSGETYRGIQLAFARKLRGGGYEQVTGWATCRNSTLGQANKGVTVKRPGKSPYSNCSGRVDADTMRFLVYFKRPTNIKGGKTARDNRLGRYIKSSLTLLNFFEEMGHLKRSKVYATEHDLPNSNVIFLFEGSGEWMRSTHLVSLYALLIRSGKYREFEDGIKDHKDFLKKVKKIKADYNKNSYNRDSRFVRWPLSSHNDVGYLHDIGPKLHILMEHRKRIFSKKKKIDHYKSTSSNSDGIAQFMTGLVDDKEIQQRFVASCDKYETKAVSKSRSKSK